MGFSAKDALDVVTKSGSPKQPKNDITNNNQSAEDFLAKGSGSNDATSTYSIKPSNWFTAKPYGFKAKTRDGKIITMFLPINPSNLTINTEFATNVIPTLYGTVEEHSDVRYYDIVIEGTTGMAPKFVDPYLRGEPSDAYAKTVKSGRSSFAVSQSLSMNGFFSKTLGLVNNIINKSADLADGKPKPQAGFANQDSGYVAFHNLYRFLLQYKKDAAGISSTAERSSHPLTFFNYKDNNEYDVVIKSFSMRRSADNPMLYFYSIQMRGYNLRTISSQIPDDLSKRFKDLGLDGVKSSSQFGDIKSVSNQAKAIIGSLAGGINILGR